MISVEHLTKCYGGFKAVDDLSFEIDEGHVYGFLGPNGAGLSSSQHHALYKNYLHSSTNDRPQSPKLHFLPHKMKPFATENPSPLSLPERYQSVGPFSYKHMSETPTT